MVEMIIENDDETLDLLLERVLSKLYNSLSSPGYLILGEAETL